MFDFNNLIWVVLLLVSFAPLVKQRIVESSRLRLMQRIEQKHGSRVIALIHRQESMSILGIPIARYIDIQDSEAVLRAGWGNRMRERLQLLSLRRG